MSSVELHARRQRLWFNGQKSSELEVLSVPALRALRVDSAKVRAHDLEIAALRRQVRLEQLTRLRWRRLQKLVLWNRHRDIVPQVAEALRTQVIPKRVTISQIARAVCKQYRVKPADITSSRRTANVILPRHVLFYLARLLTLSSLPMIGAKCGGKDHTTVLHGARRIAELIKTDPQLAAEVEAIRASLTSFPTAVPIEG